MSAAAKKRTGPTPEQKKAADPSRSAWVSASAGSGKTYVLARRVLRLLRADVPPGRILCVTFTRAAAAEMTSRVFAALGQWAVMSDAGLARELQQLEGHAPSARDLAQARRLFAAALETPGGLKIQTIHAFAERVLHRFPFEANIAAHFDVLDEIEATGLREEAIAATLTRAGHDPQGPLGRALDRIAAHAGETRFADIVAAMLARRDDFLRWIVAEDGLDGALASLAAELGAEPDVEPESVEEEICASPAFPEADWADALAALRSGDKPSDRKQADRLAAALAAGGEARREAYLSLFVTDKGGMRKNIVTKALGEANPALKDALEQEQQRLEVLIARIRAQRVQAASAALFRLAEAVIDHYEQAKRGRGLLDYDDLIGKTLALLTRAGAAQWVLYKLDGGIDHILIDEAQDTSPRQWEIIRLLAEEGLSGEGARAAGRSVFAVGDEKQSIYSFQGADPARFDEMRRYFEGRVTAAGREWATVPLNVSFRSGPAVLEAVDRVFAPPGIAGSLGAAARVVHTPQRRNAPGLVEIWPPELPEKSAEPDPWDAPFDRFDTAGPRARLARRIADTIAGWLAERRILKAAGRPLDPGDILILVRRRNEFVDALVGALRDRNVPVAGADRLVLQEHIAVMDLLAAADVALLPEDDLALATLLKSPLVGLSEEALIELAAERDGSLMQALSARAHEAAFTDAHAFVARIRRIADFAPPFAFFSELLGPMQGRRRLLARLGPEAADALNEFLDVALDYEHGAVPSLQGFVHAARAQRAEIKRNMDQARGEVRIMTVHGAKGLEAPLVILPDTCEAPTGRHDGPIFALRPDGAETDAPAPLAWAPGGKDNQPAAIDRARTQLREAQRAEYHRQLYVAMTRACDLLYVCGAQNTESLPDGCWYQLVSDALRPVLVPVADADGKPVAWRFERGTRGKAARKEAQAAGKAAGGARLPAWLRAAAPEPPPRPRVLVPSREGRIAQTTPRAEAPEGLAARERGTLIHALLERLPDTAPAGRGAAARRLLAALAPDLAAADGDAMIAETLALLEAPASAALFGPGSRAEVALGGRIAATGGAALAISGQIDRLAVTEREVLVADYKTGRDVPADVADTPPAYVAQLAAYRLALREIFPGKPVRCLIVWTAGPRIVELPADMLDRAAKDLVAGPAGQARPDAAS